MMDMISTKGFKLWVTLRRAGGDSDSDSDNDSDNSDKDTGSDNNNNGHSTANSEPLDGRFLEVVMVVYKTSD